MATKKTPEEVVRAWHEVYSQRKLDAALEFMSEDFRRIGDCTRMVPIDKQQWAADQRGFFVAFPNWHWDLTKLMASGDTVVCEFNEHGTFTEPYTDFNRIVGNFLGRPMSGLTLAPTGESYSDYNCDWFRVNEEGLITEIRAYITNNLERTFRFESRIMELVNAPQRAASAAK
jgi:hypothetical protein